MLVWHQEQLFSLRTVILMQPQGFSWRLFELGNLLQSVVSTEDGPVGKKPLNYLGKLFDSKMVILCKR